MEESVCLEDYFFSRGQDGNCKHIPLTVCSIGPGGRWACSDLMLWACERRGEGRNILLLSGWAGSSLPALHPAFPGISALPVASLSDYQVLVAVKGTGWISLTRTLIQFDTGGSGLESLTNMSQKQRGGAAQSCTHLPAASSPTPP